MKRWKLHVFAASIVPADGLAPNGAKPSAGRAMIDVGSPVYATGSWRIIIALLSVYLTPLSQARHKSGSHWTGSALLKIITDWGRIKADLSFIGLHREMLNGHVYLNLNKVVSFERHWNNFNVAVAFCASRTWQILTHYLFTMCGVGWEWGWCMAGAVIEHFGTERGGETN